MDVEVESAIRRLQQEHRTLMGLQAESLREMTFVGMSSDQAEAYGVRQDRIREIAKQIAGLERCA
jgi:hypothetical protein